MAAESEIPKVVEEALNRGRDRANEESPFRNECLEFWRGNQYIYRTTDNHLTSQSTVTNPDGSGKPRHRVRTTRNLLVDIVAHEVSATSARIPSYDVTPSTTDPADISAARLARKVALYGYDKWHIRRVTRQAATYAIVADEGFVWPYWDSSVGPFIKPGDADALQLGALAKDGPTIGQGEVKLRVYGPNEVFWEPGVRFEESRWHAIEQARDPKDIYETEGYEGPKKLVPDANSRGQNQDKYPTQARLVMETHYLERPSPQNEKGRWLTFAGGKQILREQPYPCVDHEGEVVDEPVLHRLSYFSDPDRDRDMGLVRHLLGAQRTINDCTNKQLEWKNAALMPQLLLTNMELDQQLTDEPNAVYTARGSGSVNWRPVPPIPPELSKLKVEAKEDMARIAAQNDIPSQVESGKGIIALTEKDRSRRADFFANLADFHSRLMRHCLWLVQAHYTEERLLTIRGDFGPESIRDFMGSRLRGQADVFVDPASVEPRTREQQEQKVMMFAQAGWIRPDEAMAALNEGRADHIIRPFELAKQRAWLIIQKIKDGPEALFNQPPRVEMQPIKVPDPLTGQTVETGQMEQVEVPAWMPRRFDNIPVQKSIFEEWMQTYDYDILEAGMQEAANLYYQALLSLEAEKAAEAEAQQIQLAQKLGTTNAARPTSKPMPSAPKAENLPLQAQGNGQLP
jgi:hypothetical protein